MKRIYLFAFALMIGLVACQSNTEKNESQQVVQQEVETTITLSDYPASVAFEDAKLINFTYLNGKFAYSYDSKTYKLGQQTSDAESKMCANSGEGQHIHFIVDDQPYNAYYTAEFEHPMEDGTYNLLSFLSRSYHESIKNGKAYLAKKVTFKGGKLTANENITDPMLFYSRPKGTYTGEDTKKVMLDFFVVNLELGDNYKVKVDVNGETLATVSEWKPYFLEGLPMGENTVTLTLVDAEGKTVEAPSNPVSRTFNLAAETPQ